MKQTTLDIEDVRVPETNPIEDKPERVIIRRPNYPKKTQKSAHKTPIVNDACLTERHVVQAAAARARLKLIEGGGDYDGEGCEDEIPLNQNGKRELVTRLLEQNRYTMTGIAKYCGVSQALVSRLHKNLHGRVVIHPLDI